MIQKLSWSECIVRAHKLAPYVRCKSFYGVPRGGCIPAIFLAQSAQGTLAGDPGLADVIVDDIIDSGRTRERFTKSHPGKPFIALVDKRGDDADLGWVQFPWEKEAETDIEDSVVRLLQFIGEDTAREGLIKTPARVIKAWKELTAGYGQDPEKILATSFASKGHDQMITLRKYPFVSICEHHMLPFIGEATIAYIPNDRVVGLSKLGRLVDCYARRLQIQEVMTDQIAAALEHYVTPQGVGVRLVASHQCMSCRGVNKSGEMVTTALRGAFRKPEVKAEFLMGLIGVCDQPWP